MSTKKDKLTMSFFILTYSGDGSLNLLSNDKIKQTIITQNPLPTQDKAKSIQKGSIIFF
jgi:hypothetical protein